MSDDLKDLIPPDDERRVQALRELGILDTPREQRFDQLTQELAEQLGAPIAYLALIDSDRQWLKSKVGDIPTEAKRQHAFCSHTILGRETLVVEDATKDPRFSGGPLVTDVPHLRFYAGVPISDRQGHTLGTVCVAGPQPREMSARELVVLQGYANRLAEEVVAKPMVLAAYASADLDWMSRFLAQGRALERQGLIDSWSSDRLKALDSWALKDSLFRARTVVLLVSPQFLSSDWVQDHAFQLLLTVRELEALTTIPLLLEPCDWSEVSWLAQRNPWPQNGGPLSALPEEQADQLLSELAKTLLPGAAKEGPTELQASEAAEGIASVPEPEEIEISTRLFLSHAGEDGVAVKALAERLKQAGVDVWLDLDELQPGDDWMEALEDALQESTSFAVYIGRSGVARWINREVRVALDRNTKDRSYRFIPILAPGSDPETLPSFVAQHHWLDLRDGENDPARLQKLVAAIMRRPAEAVSLIPPGEAPFRGLSSFDSDHAHLFFGRDRETQVLIDRLRAGPFLAVVGDSGSGKSSLVKAGLIPALNAGQMLEHGSPVRNWRTAVMRPGSDPFRELGNALMDLQPEMGAAERIATHEALTKQLAQGTDGLCKCVSSLAAKGERTVLVVDQFEEVFTHSGNLEERNRFIDTLLESSDCTGDRPFYTIITLRADLYSRCFEHPKLPMVIAGNQFAVRAIDREQMADVIKKPAAMAGLKLEPGLVEAILFDLGEGSGNLPLLQHTLLQLWNQRTGEILTHKSYDAIGRVQGALEHHAEEVYGRFDDEDQEAARKVFLRLVVADRSGDATRRRVARERLIPPGEAAPAAERVLQSLVDQRLVTVQQSGDGDDGVEEVEVVHEALLRAWTRLREWLDRDREFLLWRQRTRTAFEAWEESGRDHGALLHGGPLAEARRWLAERGEDLSEDGRTFIGESLALARKKQWLKRAAVATIAALALVASWLAWQARQESYRARTQALVEQARARQQDRLDLALLLSLEVDRRGDELETRRLLSEGLESGAGLEMFLHGHQGDVRGVAWSSDGRTLASASGAEPALMLWDVAAGSPVGQALGGADAGLYSVAWSPVGRLLAAGGEGGAVLVWDLEAGLSRPRRLEDTANPAQEIYALRFTHDGRTLAAARSDHSVQLWNVATGEPVGTPLKGATDWLKALAWSPDGTVVAAAGMDKLVRRWNAATGESIEPPLRGHGEGVMSLDWSDDGRYLASGGLDGMTVIWDATTGERHRKLADSLIGSVASVAWRPDSLKLAVGGTGGRVQSWDVARERPLGPPAVGQLAPLLGVAWSPDGRRLASGNGSTVVLWRADGGPSLGRPLQLEGSEVRALTSSPDGALLAAVGLDPMSRKPGIRVWSRADGKLQSVTEDPGRGAPALAWLADGSLTSATSDRTVRRWEVATGDMREERRAGEGGRVAESAWSGDGARLAVADREGGVAIWDWESGATVPALEALPAEDGSRNRVTKMSWSPQGALLAVGAEDGRLRLWDASAAQERGAPLAAHAGHVTALAWSPDGQTLVTGGADGSVKFWNVSAGKGEGAALATDGDRVTNLAWSPDGKTLAAAGKDGIRLWDAIRREVWAGPLQGHDETIIGLEFSPDGATLTSVSFDGMLRHWDLDLELWRERACRMAGRNLTRDEWQKYLPFSSYRKTCETRPQAEQRSVEP